MYDYLEAQGRWDSWDRPDFFLVAYVLRQLPVEEAKMLDRDRLYIKLRRELTPGEVFQLGRLNPDFPHELAYPHEMTEFTFEWT